MATLSSNAVASTVQSRAGIDLTSVTGVYTLTAALALNDVIQMVKVPLGACIQEILVTADDLDTGGSAIRFQCGDGGSAARFIAANAVGSNAGLAARLDTHAGHGYVYPAEDTIDLTVSTGPTGGATSGSIRLTAFYTMQQPVT